MRSGSHLTKYGKPKISHIDQDQAEEHAQALRIKHPNDVMNAYLCWCKSWHVGHERTSTKPKGYERQIIKHEENLVGKLIGVLRGTYKP